MMMRELNGKSASIKRMNGKQKSGYYHLSSTFYKYEILGFAFCSIGSFGSPGIFYRKTFYYVYKDTKVYILIFYRCWAL